MLLPVHRDMFLCLLHTKSYPNHQMSEGEIWPSLSPCTVINPIFLACQMSDKCCDRHKGWCIRSQWLQIHHLALLWKQLKCFVLFTISFQTSSLTGWGCFLPGGRLNIKMSHDHLIFNMGIPIPGKDGPYIETGPDLKQSGLLFDGAVHPKNNVHGFCFVVLWHRLSLPIYFRVMSLTLWQWYDCPSPSIATAKNISMG